MHRALELVSLAFVAVVLSACSSEPTWYDQSKELKHEKEARVQRLVDQGMDVLKAKQAVDYESMQRNTERGDPTKGEGVQPVEGRALQEALSRPPGQ